MLTKCRTMVCSSLAAVFAFVAVGPIGPCCPFWFYQPELPQKE
jgi:cyclic lactone autoinducer peptide